MDDGTIAEEESPQDLTSGTKKEKCHRVFCDQVQEEVCHVRIMFVKHKIASLFSCKAHHELIQMISFNFFMSLAEFWHKYQRCLEQIWEDNWEETAHELDLEVMFESALKCLKLISLLRNEMKPELILAEKHEMLEEAHSTIFQNAERIRQLVRIWRRKGHKLEGEKSCV